jgi:chromosome segregation ATPase
LLLLQRLTNRLQRAESDRDDYKADLQKQRKAVALIQTQLGDAEKRSQMYKDSITGLELELTAQRSQAKSFQAANPESNLQRIQQLTVEVQALSEAKAVQASEITVLKDRLKLMGREIEDQLDALVHANKRADQAEARLGSSDSEHSGILIRITFIVCVVLLMFRVLPGLMMELESLRGQSAELAQLREQNRTLNERIVSLSRQFEDISAQQQNTVAVSEHDALLMQVNELKRANALEESRHAREKSEMIAMHQLELTQRASQLDSLKAELRELQFVKRENVELKNTVETHKEQYAKEKQQLQAEYDRQAALQEKEMAHLNTRVADLLSQIAELNVLIEKPKAQAAELQRMRDRESELRNVVARLIKSEEATEPAFTCLSCSSIYRAPVTCIPCGHSFCLACIGTFSFCPFVTKSFTLNTVVGIRNERPLLAMRSQGEGVVLSQRLARAVDQQIRIA